MGGHGIARIVSLAVCLWLFGVGVAWSQIGRMHVPPMKQRPVRVEAVLIEWTGSGGAGSTSGAAAALEADGGLPPGYRVISRTSGHALRSYRHRIARAEQNDLLLTFVGRDRRRVRALLEVEDAPLDETRTLELRLDRSYGRVRSRSVHALGPAGPWLRIDLQRP